MSEATIFLRETLDNPDASTAEKINAAKALEQIERRAGLNAGRMTELSVTEIDAEIARIRALIDAQDIEKTE